MKEKWPQLSISPCLEDKGWYILQIKYSFNGCPQVLRYSKNKRDLIIMAKKWIKDYEFTPILIKNKLRV